MSDVMWDLITTLLTRDPKERAKWEDIRQHAFWEMPLEVVTIPEQPLFSQFLSSQPYADSYKTPRTSQVS